MEVTSFSSSLSPSIPSCSSDVFTAISHVKLLREHWVPDGCMKDARAAGLWFIRQSLVPIIRAWQAKLRSGDAAATKNLSVLYKAWQELDGTELEFVGTQ